MICHLSRPVIRDHRDPWLTAELSPWRIVAVSAALDVFRTSMCHLCSARTSGASNASEAIIPTTSLLAIAIRIITLLKSERE